MALFFWGGGGGVAPGLGGVSGGVPEFWYGFGGLGVRPGMGARRNPIEADVQPQNGPFFASEVADVAWAGTDTVC